MNRYVVDERVPCHLTELRPDEPQRKSFSDPAAKVYLAADTTAVPFIQGYRLSTPNSAWFVEDLQPVWRLAEGGVVPASLGAHELAELESFNAAALLTRHSAQRGELRLCDQGERFRELYEPDRCSWFALSPLHLELDLTNRCNQNCVHCCRDSSPQARVDVELSSRELFLILDEAADIGVDEVSFLGGEPTLHPHLVELAYFAKKRGIHRLNLATNALAMSEELVQLTAALFSHIQISLHGASAETHETIVRHPGGFDRVVHNIERLKARGADVVLAFTVMASNRRELPGMLDLGRRLGVNGIRFIPLAGEGRGQDLPPLGLGDYQEVGEFIRRAREHEPDMAVTSGGFPIGEQMPNDALFYGCVAGLTKLYLNSRGIVGGCSLLGSEQLNARNRSLLEIWHEKEMRSNRRRVSCDCPFVARCAGGCLSVPKHSQAVKLEVRDG